MKEIEHAYGSQVHILDDAYLRLGLARLCSPECRQPELHFWIGRLYSSLLQHAINVGVEKKLQKTSTRMASLHPLEAQLESLVPDPEAKIVVVNIARAGTVPSYVCYDELNHFFKPENIRQDHLIMAREVDKQGRVTGSAMGASKIGGPIADNYVLIPDPMGATGSTIIRALEGYKIHGQAKKWIALHLIVTPEYLRALSRQAPEVEIVALRVDRGLSSAEVLKTKPGSRWDEERGLNDKHYIVPGGGGLGELLNNTLG